MSLGNYSATVSYSGDDDFEEDTASTTFSVTKWNPNLSIMVDDTYVGEDTTAYINARYGFSRDVVVSLEGSSISQTYDVSVEDGYGEVTFNESLPAGNYTATVRYTEESDEKFAPGEASTRFRVETQTSPNLRIRVKDIRVGGKATAVITAVKEFSSIVFVKYSGAPSTKTVIVEDGRGEVTFDESLTAGNYSALATYAGGDGFEEDTASTTFSVVEYDPDFPSYRDAYKYRGGFHKFVYDILRKMS